jgi:hypothetical protein
MGHSSGDQNIDLLQCLHALLPEEDTSLHRPVVHLGGHQGRGLQSGARSRVQFRCSMPQDLVPSAGPFGIGHPHEDGAS